MLDTMAQSKRSEFARLLRIQIESIAIDNDRPDRLTVKTVIEELLIVL
jgi:hypothetical protein